MLILYSGVSDENRGHAFVCDGIASYDWLHINWGWKGLCNGYFNIDDLKPSIQETPFSTFQAMVCGIHPASSPMHLGANVVCSSVEEAYDTPTAPSFSFTLINASAVPINIIYGFAIYDADSNLVSTIIGNSYPTKLYTYMDTGHSSSVSMRTPITAKSLSDGFYHIVPFWADTDDSDDAGMRSPWGGDLMNNIWIEKRSDGKIYKAEAPVSGMVNIAATTTDWKLTASTGAIALNGVPEGSSVSIYNTNGALVATTTTARESAVIDMNNASAGLYIVSVVAPNGATKAFKTMYK
jgi:hypothetical protein